MITLKSSVAALQPIQVLPRAAVSLSVVGIGLVDFVNKAFTARWAAFDADGNQLATYDLRLTNDLAQGLRALENPTSQSWFAIYDEPRNVNDAGDPGAYEDVMARLASAFSADTIEGIFVDRKLVPDGTVQVKQPVLKVS
jgi:hypothetical protein